MSAVHYFNGGDAVYRVIWVAREPRPINNYEINKVATIPKNHAISVV
jgi:hypothetical protein